MRSFYETVIHVIVLINVYCFCYHKIIGVIFNKIDFCGRESEDSRTIK